jgi:hypothetical protein
MIIVLTAFLAGAQVLPQIDRTALELQARAEALQPRGRATIPARTQPRPQARTTPARTMPGRTQAARTQTARNEPALPPKAVTRTAAARPQPTRPAPARQTAARQAQNANAPAATQRRTQPRRASGGNPLDLASITTICRAAGNQEDPAGFIARLSTAYSLSAEDSTSLRASCAAYLAGRADARRASGGTY